jgi:hypothetical protein
MNTSNTPIQAQEFFKFWVDACKQRHATLVQDFSKSPLFTAHILTDTNSIIEIIAKRMELTCYCGYYSIDAILFKDRDDRVPDAPPGTTWIRRIRVAFEHENYFNSGLFQEVSHLLITDCDLRVLVSYPNRDDELKQQLIYLHEIIKGSDRSNQISETASFLFIVDMGTFPSFDWWGYIYKNDDWQKLV